MKTTTPGHLFLARFRDRVKSAEASSHEWLRHPIILAIIGFFLTGVVGSYLTNKWQIAQWQKEQRYAIWQLSLADRRALSEKVLSSVAANVSTVADVLTLYDWEFKGPLATRTETNKRISAWVDRTSRWRAEEEVIGQQLAVTYCDRRIPDVFLTIRRDNADLTIYVTGLLVRSNRRAIKKADRDAANTYRNAVLTSKRITANVRRLSVLMSAEIDRERHANTWM